MKNKPALNTGRRGTPFTRLFRLSILLIGLVGSPASLKAGAAVEVLTIRTASGKEVAYQVEIADTDASRQKGLMYRTEMPSNRGMLLDFGAPEKVSIWMKNTFIPLDIIYVDAAGIITQIVEQAEPQSTSLMNSNARVRAVLEVNAGQAAYHGFKAGDQVIHHVFKPGTTE